MNKKLKLIIKREFNAKVRNKSFIIMTILAPFLMVAGTMLIVFLGKANNNEIKTIAYVDQTNLIDENVLKDTESIHYLKLPNSSVDDAKKEAIDKEYYGLLYLPKQDSLELLAKNIQFYSKKSPNMDVISTLENKIEDQISLQKMQRLGMDVNRIKSTEIKADLKLENYEGEKSSKLENGMKIALGSFGGYLIMMFIMIFGTSVMRSVLEEKTSRIIEVIISSIKPFQLMMGKIIGNALAALTQFAIWGILATILIFVVSAIIGIDVNEMTSSDISPEQAEIMKDFIGGNGQEALASFFKLPLLSFLLYFLIYFLGGYLLYSSLYAAIGAAVDSETDSQQFMMPIMIPLMLAVYVGFISVTKEPHGSVAVIFSMIPLTSPIVMLMRIPFGVPPIQIAISIFLLVGMFIFMVWFAAKIYRVGILMYGKKPTYKELFKWLKY